MKNPEFYFGIFHFKNAFLYFSTYCRFKKAECLQSYFGDVIINIVANVFTVLFGGIHFFLYKDRNGDDSGYDSGPLNNVE